MPRTKVTSPAKGQKRGSKPASKRGAERRKTAPSLPAVPSPEQYGATRAQASKFAALGERFAGLGWGQAAEVLREVRAVPTVLPWVDYVLRVGGWPTDRFGLIHGPSNEGKTTFCMGLMLSFLMADHAAAFVDAERSSPPTWFRRFMGSYVDHPGFRALYPKTYEQTVDMVRAWCETIGDAKAMGDIDEDTTGIIVVDSLRKLVPKKLFEKLAKEGAEGSGDEGKGRFGKKAGGVDGMGGRAAQLKAALNAAWMDELTVLLSQTGTCMVAIGREYENSEAGLSFGKSEDFKLGGGGALFFESSVVARVTRAEVIRDESMQHKLVAEKHCVQIRKTKIEAKEVAYPRAYFHSTPQGFDRARDVLALGRELGLVTLGGSWLSFEGDRLGNGEDAALARLRQDLQLQRRIEDVIRRQGIPEDALPQLDEEQVTAAAPG